MKLLLILPFLFACGETNHLDRLKKEAIEFCSCREGLDHALIARGSIKITCKDGTYITSKGGRLEDITIKGCYESNRE